MLSRKTPPPLPGLSYSEDEYDRIIYKAGLPSRRIIYNTLASRYSKDDRKLTHTHSPGILYRLVADLEKVWPSGHTHLSVQQCRI